MATAQLIEAVMVTSELCGRTFSDMAGKLFIDELAAYPEHQVLPALKRCRREVKGALTLHDVLSRIDDGRPGAEEAWAMIPKTEDDTAVWTTEASQAFGVAVGLLDGGDKIGARMAFKETYGRLVQQARDHGKQVEWHISLGHDPRARDGVLMTAVAAGRISMDRVLEFSPTLKEPSAEMVRLTSTAVLRVAA